jgi:hypothetical protein
MATRLRLNIIHPTAAVVSLTHFFERVQKLLCQVFKEKIQTIGKRSTKFDKKIVRKKVIVRPR